MDKKTLEKYKPKKRELKMIEKQLERLYGRRLDIPVVKGKVTASSKEFPYIETHVSVQMDEPHEADELNRKIKKKEARREELRAEMKVVEQFISVMPEGEDKQIFELYYLEGLKQSEIADEVGLERSSISKRIGDYCKVSHNSQFDML